jgi:hypothetical protein
MSLSVRLFVLSLRDGEIRRPKAPRFLKIFSRELKRPGRREKGKILRVQLPSRDVSSPPRPGPRQGGVLASEERKPEPPARGDDSVETHGVGVNKPDAIPDPAISGTDDLKALPTFAYKHANDWHLLTNITAYDTTIWWRWPPFDPRRPHPFLRVK